MANCGSSLSATLDSGTMAALRAPVPACMPHHIAIVEDEAALAANYRDALQRQGFRVSIHRDRQSASAAFLRQLPDLAIIDVGLGADDYLTKDISQAHMLARIVALFRRVRALREPEPREHIIAQGALTLNLERMTAHWQEYPVPLTVTEFWMVHTLARHPGHVKNRQQLMESANVVLDDNTITSHIKRVRRKFETRDPDFGAIETAYGMGYRWRGG